SVNVDRGGPRGILSSRLGGQSQPQGPCQELTPDDPAAGRTRRASPAEGTRRSPPVHGTDSDHAGQSVPCTSGTPVKKAAGQVRRMRSRPAPTCALTGTVDFVKALDFAWSHTKARTRITHTRTRHTICHVGAHGRESTALVSSGCAGMCPHG